MKGDMLISARVAVKETVDGAYMVTVDGVQWGPPDYPRDASGAANATYETALDAEHAYCRHNPDMPDLSDMAKEKVGDGKEPNLFFVTVEGETYAAFTVLDDAEEYAKTFHSPTVIEDRLAGVVWENEASIAMQQTEEEGDARCPHTANGRHVMSPFVARAQDGRDVLVIDVECRACGRSGSITVEPDDVNW